MCGISGIVGPGWQLSQLQSMVGIQCHRGPNNSEHFVNNDGNAGLGHNRLSIIDLASSANCPMTDHSGNLTIVFNGEIYNYIELKQQLCDYNFKTSSDTEVILAAYNRWGTQCVNKFIGMFAFAIWDDNNKILFCSRDRLGIKPFYYYYSGNTFYFASEIKALLAAGIKAEPNWNQWSTYLKTGFYDHSEETFFSGINSLPGGNNLQLRKEQLDITSYWELQESNPNPESSLIEHYTEELQELMINAVTLHLRSDVPVNVNLSGGLDSGLLATCIENLGVPKTLYTFTSSFKDKSYDEYETIKHLGLKDFTHIQNVTLPESIPDLANELLWHQEAPFGGIPTIAYYNLHKTIKSYGQKVSLEGQGLDELFGGYKYYEPYHYADIATKYGWDYLKNNTPKLNLSPNTQSQIISVMNNNMAIQSQDGTNHLRIDCLSREILERQPLFTEFKKPFDSHLNNIIYQDLMHTKLPRVLRMNDRLSMACGVELRVPFLDHRIVEYAFQLPNEYKIKSGQGKYILRHLGENWLEQTYTSKPKIPVVTPQTEWFKHELKTWVIDTITSSSFKSRGLFDSKDVEKAYAEIPTDAAARGINSPQ